MIEKELQKDQRVGGLVIHDDRSPLEDVTTEGMERDSEGSMKETKTEEALEARAQTKQTLENMS